MGPEIVCSSDNINDEHFLAFAKRLVDHYMYIQELNKEKMRATSEFSTIERHVDTPV